MRGTTRVARNFGSCSHRKTPKGAWSEGESECVRVCVEGEGEERIANAHRHVRRGTRGAVEAALARACLREGSRAGDGRGEGAQGRGGCSGSGAGTGQGRGRHSSSCPSAVYKAASKDSEGVHACGGGGAPGWEHVRCEGDGCGRELDNCQHKAPCAEPGEHGPNTSLCEGLSPHTTHHTPHTTHHTPHTTAITTSTGTHTTGRQQGEGEGVSKRVHEWARPPGVGGGAVNGDEEDKPRVALTNVRDMPTQPRTHTYTTPPRTHTTKSKEHRAKSTLTHTTQSKEYTHDNVSGGGGGGGGFPP
jgi:hypothetical protein